MTEIEEYIQQFPPAVQEILNKLRQYHTTYSIAQTVPAQLKLSWSHYLVLMMVNDIKSGIFTKLNHFQTIGV